MKSYFLGIVVAIALSAIYVTYNTADVTINYLGFSASINQGIWDVFLFGAGALIMWILSICAAIETYSANKKRARELSKKIEVLEDEKKSLLSALQNVRQSKPAEQVIAETAPAVQTNIAVPSHEAADEINIPEQTASKETTEEENSLEKTSPAENRESGVKSFFAAIFKGGKKQEPADDKTEAYDIEDDSVEADDISLTDDNKSVPDDEFEIGGRPESDENAEAEEWDDGPRADVCEPDPGEDVSSEDENDSGEKRDREIFPV